MEKSKKVYRSVLSTVHTSDASIGISIKEAYMLDGAAGHKHKHKNIATLRSSSAYAYTYVAVMTSGWYTGKHKISISEKLSTNQRALYSYADHVLTGHKLSRSRRAMLMLES